MTSASSADLSGARRFQEGMRELIIHHPGGWADANALARAKELCSMALAAVDDRECRARVSEIDVLLADLYSELGHRKWNRTQTSGRDFLRLMVLRELSAFEARLIVIQQAQRAADPNATIPIKDP